MNGQCPRCSELDAWQRLGAAAAMPEALAQHLLQCAACRASAADISALRASFAQLPSFELEQRRRDEMRFLLMAETRRQPARSGNSQPLPSPEAPPRQRWFRRQPLLRYAGVLASLAAAASALSSVGTPWDEDRHERSAALPARERTPGAAVPELSRLEPPSHDPALPPSGNPALPRSCDPALPPSGDPALLEPVLLEPPSSRAQKATPAERASARRIRSANPAAPSVDVRFRRAHTLLRRGRALEAVSAFDRLADEPSLDTARRGDALFWAARASRAAGDAAGAHARAERYLATYPDGWYAAHADALRAAVPR